MDECQSVHVAPKAVHWDWSRMGLTNATCKGGFENNTRDGQVRVRWEGLTCEEMAL